MGHNIRIRRAWSLVPLAVVLVLVVAAVPASAKGPIYLPHGCSASPAKAPPQQYAYPTCEPTGAAKGGTDAAGPSAALVGGGMAAAILFVGGAMLFSRRRELDDPRAAALS